MNGLKDVSNEVQAVLTAFKRERTILDVRRLILACQDRGLYKEIISILYAKKKDVDYQPLEVIAGINLNKLFGACMGEVIGVAGNSIGAEGSISAAMNDYLIDNCQIMTAFNHDALMPFEDDPNLERYARVAKEIDERETKRVEELPDYEGLYYDAFSDVQPDVSTEQICAAWDNHPTPLTLPPLALPGPHFFIPMEKLHILSRQQCGFRIEAMRYKVDYWDHGIDPGDADLLLMTPETEELYKSAISEITINHLPAIKAAFRKKQQVAS